MLTKRSCLSNKGPSVQRLIALSIEETWDSRLKRSRMFVGEFELNPLRPFCVWFERYFTPSRCTLIYTPCDWTSIPIMGVFPPRDELISTIQ